MGNCDPVAGAALGTFALARLLSSVLTPPLTSAAQIPDMGTYRAPHGFLNFSLTSFTGDAVRPWGVTVWMALWPESRTLVLAQTTLAILAWACLAIVLSGGLARLALRRLLLVTVLLLGSTASVIGWDSAILSESVSVSTGLLSLAALIALARRPSPGRAVRFILLALWFTMTRPNYFPVLLAWAVVAAVMMVRTSRRRLWGFVAVGLVAMSAYTVVYNVNSDDAWRRTLFGFSRTTAAYGYAVGSTDPVARQVLADLRRSDAPRCMLPARPEDVGVRGTYRWIQDTSARCPQMDVWASAHWRTWWANWLATHPSAATTIVARGVVHALAPPVYSSVTAAVPQPAADVFFGSGPLPGAPPPRTYRVVPLLLWFSAAVVLSVPGRRRRRSAPPGLELVLWLTAGGALASMVAGTLLLQTPPYETAREAAAATIVLVLAVVSLVPIGVDRWTRTSPASPVAEKPDLLTEPT